MSQTTLHLRTSKAELQAALAKLPAILAGKEPDPTGLAQGIPLAVGIEALSIIRTAFIAKSRGGTDEAGESWAPLSKKYLAYGRRHPGLNRKRGAAAKKGRASRPLLTEAQNQRWKQLYAGKLRQLARAAGGSVATGPSADIKGHAAAYAWLIVKAEGGKTILGTYGDAPHEIGRDTGQMFASLSPGAPRNRLDVQPGAVIVGTNVKHAGHFHKRRRLWPEEGRWPQVWLDRLAGVALAAAEQVAAALAGRA